MNEKIRATFHIKDTCFAQECVLIVPRGWSNVGSLEPVAILTTYLKQKRNVAQNLAWYYASLADGDNLLISDFNFIEKYHPILRYSQNYYKSMKRYYDEFKVVNTI